MCEFFFMKAIAVQQGIEEADVFARPHFGNEFTGVEIIPNEQ